MMFKFLSLVFAVFFLVRIKGANIMLNKPAIQSSTISELYLTSQANDGSVATRPSHTKHELNPYWQGDLLGFYTVHEVLITSDNSSQANHLRNAFVGVSVHDVKCSDSEMTPCGQWPEVGLPGQTLAFNCSHAGPVRFVRIWRNLEATDGLAIDEVEVYGDPFSLPGASLYKKSVLKKLGLSTMSFSVSNAYDCGNLCRRTQPCVAFSYRPIQQANCLLATDVNTTSDVNWDTYQIQECFYRHNCRDKI